MKKIEKSMVGLILLALVQTVAVGAEGVAFTGNLVANPSPDMSAIASPVVMGRKYWTMLLSGPFADPARKLPEKMRASGLQDLPLFRDCALFYSIGRKVPNDPAVASFRRVIDNCVDWEIESNWKELESNPKPDKPVTIIFSSKRSYAAQVGKIDLDMDDYRAWLKRHPNLLAYNTLDEWVGDAINIVDKVDRRKTQAERDEIIARLGSFPKTRAGLLQQFKAYADHQRALYWNDDEHFGALDSCSFNNHMTAAWGAKLIQFEVTDSLGGMDYRWDVCLPFLRGAARQFGIPWAWYYANCYRGHATNGEKYMSECVYARDPKAIGDLKFFPEGGSSPSLERRASYFGYVNGATIHLPENWSTRLLTTNELGQTILSVQGRNFSDYHDFTAAHPDRGEAYAPVAVLTSVSLCYHPWGGVTMYDRCEKYRPGDHMLDGVIFSYVPGLDTPALLKQGVQTCFRNAPLAQMYDILVPDSTQPAEEFLKRLGAYPVAILAGAYEDVGAFWPTLGRYIRQGGTLLAPRANVPTRALEKLVNFKGADVVGDDGRTIATAYDLGKGRLIVSTSEWMTPPTPDMKAAMIETRVGKRKFPEIEFFLRKFQSELFPFEVFGACQYGASKKENGWWLWVFNHDGVVKFIDTPQTVDRKKDSSVEVKAANGAKATDVRELLSGKRVQVENGAFRWTIPAGDLAVFEIVN